MSIRKLPINIKVKFNIAQDLDIGVAIIRDTYKDPEDGHLYYRLEVIEGNATMHRNDKGALWANDFEVKPIATHQSSFPIDYLIPPIIQSYIFHKKINNYQPIPLNENIDNNSLLL